MQGDGKEDIQEECGGVDIYLTVILHIPQDHSTVKLPDLPPPGCVSLARQVRSVLLSRYSTGLRNRFGFLNSVF